MDRLTARDAEALVEWLREQIEDEREWRQRERRRLDSAQVAVSEAREEAYTKTLAQLGREDEVEQW